MLNEGRAQAVVAFKGGKGTQMMVDLAKKAGIPVWEVPEREVSYDEFNKTFCKINLVKYRNIPADEFKSLSDEPGYLEQQDNLDPSTEV